MGMQTRDRVRVFAPRPRGTNKYRFGSNFGKEGIMLRETTLAEVAQPVR